MQYIYESTELRAPRPNQSVYREDCTQCFDSIASILDMLNEFDLTSTRTVQLASMYASTASTAAVPQTEGILSSTFQLRATLLCSTSSALASMSPVKSRRPR